MNAALNYGYGILYFQVWGAVTLAGLEPFAGFLHTEDCSELSGLSKQ
ncbi:MAG: CRISPR-associated endonuclease Cas1 [Bacillota bacterium]